MDCLWHYSDFLRRKKKKTWIKVWRKPRKVFFRNLTRAVAGKSKIDDEVLDKLEEALVSSDVGLPTTIKIIKRIEERAAKDKFVTTAEMNGLIKEEIERLLAENKNLDLGIF